MANQDIINKGAAAKSLLESEVFSAVLDELKREAFHTWIASPTEAKDAREDLYYMQVALAHIKEKLSGMSQSGHMELMKAEQDEARQQVTADNSAVE